MNCGHYHESMATAIVLKLEVNSTLKDAFQNQIILDKISTAVCLKVVFKLKQHFNFL